MFYNTVLNHRESMFNERLKKVMAMKRMKGVELAAATGVTRSTVSQYVSGSAIPSITVLVKISEALDVSLDWLIAGRGDIFFSDKQKIEEAPQQEEPQREQEVQELRRELERLRRDSEKLRMDSERFQKDQERIYSLLARLEPSLGKPFSATLAATAAAHLSQVN